MAYAGTPAILHLSAGVMIGFGLAGSSFTVVIGAFGKLMPPQWRSLAVGAGTAAGSFGQFLFSPLAVALIDGYGWQHTLVIFAAIVLLIMPLSLAFAAPQGGNAAAATAPPQSLAQALTEALGHRSYWLLVLGFFTCGFQLFFIAVHLPAYLVDRGLPAEIGGWTLGVIGLFNMMGAVTAGWLSAFMPKRYLLSLIYFARGGDPRLHYAAAERGRDPDLRGSAGPALALNRPTHIWPGHRHVRHSLARYAVRLCLLQPSGRRFPRSVVRRPAVRAHRILRRRVVAGDPVRALISGDQSTDRGEAAAAARCRSRLSVGDSN
jgi:MFS family permease